MKGCSVGIERIGLPVIGPFGGGHECGAEDLRGHGVRGDAPPPRPVRSQSVEPTSFGHGHAVRSRCTGFGVRE